MSYVNKATHGFLKYAISRLDFYILMAVLETLLGKRL